MYYLDYLSDILVDVFCISNLNLTCMKLAGSSSGICSDVKSQQNLLKKIFLLFLLLLPVYALAQNPVVPPVAVCRNITVQLGSSGTAVIDITDIDNGSHDPDGSIVTRSVFPNTFNCSQLGQNTVVLTVTDDEGLSSTCEAIVTVEDNTPPVINVKPLHLFLVQVAQHHSQLLI